MGGLAGGGEGGLFGLLPPAAGATLPATGHFTAGAPGASQTVSKLPRPEVGAWRLGERAGFGGGRLCV